MKISVSMDFDTENPKDLNVLGKLIDSIRISYDSSEYVRTSDDLYEKAWQQCSWEIIAFAVTVLKISDGDISKGTYALFDSLSNPKLQGICGPLTERAISSRVGRTAVICKKMGDFRLMEIATRRKDQAKRVYISLEAKDALLKLLNEDWGKEFNNYLLENGFEAMDFKDL